MKESTYLVSSVFTLFNTVSLSDLSGTLGGTQGEEPRAAALDERGGLGGQVQISAMSFKKQHTPRPSEPLILASHLTILKQYGLLISTLKPGLTATAHAELQLETLINLLCFYLSGYYKITICEYHYYYCYY